MADVKAEKTIDIRGLVCPYTFVKSKLAIESMEVGQVLEILLDYEEALNSIPNSMRDHGQSVLSVDKVSEGQWTIRVRKETD